MGRTIFILLLTTILLRANVVQKGEISGSTLDAKNRLPLIGVNIYVEDSAMGAASNIDGTYQIKNLPVGTYTITFSYVGYSAVTKTDIIVKPGRTTYLNVELFEDIVEMENVTVTAGYYTSVENQPTSAISFSSEEVRRSPGTAGDISRILFSLPSVAKVNDNSNSLIVRGGSPMENSFYVDNIEIPNINHYPTQGSSEGPIGILNVDFIEDVTFHSGGFSPAYGDKMSSVMDIKLREGNPNKFQSQLVLSFAGMNALAEGPLGASGNYLVAANKSYLDLIFKAIDETGPIPEYGDFQAKLTFNIDENNKLSFLDVFSTDYINNRYENAFENGDWVYGPSSMFSNTTGLNWQHIWGKSGYSNTSVGITYTNYDYEFSRTKTQQSLLKNESKEITTTLRNVNYYNLGKTTKIDFGIEAKYRKNDYMLGWGEFHDEFGNVTPGRVDDKELNTVNASLFTSVKQTIFDRLILDLGVRADYFDYNETTKIAPRLGARYKFNDVASMHASWGIFYQNIPTYVLVQNDLFKNLKTPESQHLILGFDYLLTEETKLSVELFNKNYSNFPIDPTQPNVFLFDETVRNHVFLNHENLVDNGKAFSRGVEVILQKKFAKDFYGLVSGSYSTAQYKATDGEWRDRVYDNQYNFAIEGGYKPNSSWEFSMRWIYAGGRPFTPIDVDASIAAGNEILQQNKINSDRLPAYHSLNARVDKRFHFDNSNLIVYLSIWNAYGNENISSYDWDEINAKIDKQTGWGMLPVLGIEWEF